MNQSLRSNQSFQRRSRLQLGKLPVKVKVISDVNSLASTGFNQKRKISKSHFTGFKQEVKNGDGPTRLKEKLTVNKSPLTGFNQNGS